MSEIPARYWFARSSNGRYPDAFLPVTTVGRVIYVVMFGGVIAACVALVVIGQVFHERIWAAVVTFALIAVSVGGYAFISRWRGDHNRTVADYKASTTAVGGARNG